MDEKEKINLMNIMAGNLPILWSKLDMSQEDLLLFSTLNDTPFFTLNGGVLA